ncbi:transglycosylase domain-containing protein [Chryseobacterium nepalense]|uniref:Transglycosylase domain-containing protein n=1 Tax=Chryseobacterium nepalense TaxID=1854498 RepID=A0ABY4KA05_9FLAO|nr:transglycosylase domain-containing protein [Chryseobacterium nepalense]UPQ77626.1 transglycosylase domain-containing protein [Chryseobacterium nepalense]
MAFNFSHFDFLENRKGISKLSKSLFKKDIKDLKSIEMSEIVSLYENPVKNNRYRNPERAKTRAEYLNQTYIINSKSKK